jgi:hypothetical protein
MNKPQARKNRHASALRRRQRVRTRRLKKIEDVFKAVYLPWLSDAINTPWG